MNCIYNKIKAWLILGVLAFSANANAQHSNLLYYFENVPQTNLTNAAMMPRSNAFVGLPGLSSVGFSFKTDFSVRDLLQQDGDIWVQPLDAAFDYDDLYNSIGQAAVIKAGFSYAPIYFGFRTDKGYFTFSIQQKASMRISMPEDMFQIAEKGFDEGTTLDLEALGTKVVAYHEISIGYAQEVNSQLTVGAHLKPLSGVAAAQMKFNKFTIENNRTDYKLDVDGEVLTSAPFIKFIPNEDGFPEEVETEDDISSSDIVSEVIPNFSNFGLAVDLGAVYELNKMFSFSASLNNLGYIKWKNNLNSTTVKGSYEFTGPDISITETDDIDEAYEDIFDDILDVIEGETGEETFSTWFSPELFLGSQYHVNHVLDLGVLSKSTFEKYNFRQEFMLTSNFNLYKAFSTTLAYNYEIGAGSDIGLGFALEAGPLQFYTMLNHIPLYCDNIVDGDSEYIAPTKAECFSLMFGFNLIFGKRGFRDKPMIGKR